MTNSFKPTADIETADGEEVTRADAFAVQQEAVVQQMTDDLSDGTMSGGFYSGAISDGFGQGQDENAQPPDSIPSNSAQAENSQASDFTQAESGETPDIPQIGNNQTQSGFGQGQGGFMPNGNGGGQLSAGDNLPSADNFPAADGETAQQNGDALILLGASAAVLVAGLIVALKFKR